MAQQVGGKAARDALFFTAFPVRSLPLMVTAAAAASLLVAAGASRLLERRGPARVLPSAFLASAVLQVLVFALQPRLPRGAAVAFYLQLAVFSPVLVSGFWSAVGERFDAHAAKRFVARIAAGGTLGGLAGGLAAERIAALWGTLAVLPLMALLHAACAWRIPALAHADADRAPAPPEAPAAPRRPPLADAYLRQIAGLVLVGSVAATVIDYAFKRELVGAVGSGPPLMRVLALFYTGCGIAAFAAQALAGRASLESLGLARTLALLPLGVATGGLALLAAPGLAAVAALRAAEGVLRTSVYRLGYELLYTPVPAALKRRAKTLIDVGVDRAGEIAAASVIAVPAVAAAPLPRFAAAAALAGVGGLVLAARLRRSYVRALERSLVARAVALRVEDAVDATTRGVLETLPAALLLAPADPSAPTWTPLPGAEALDTGLFVLDRARAGPARTPVPTAGAARAPRPPEPGSLDARFAALRSGEAERVRAALRAGPLDPLLAPAVARLLAWEEVAADAAEALRPLAPRIVGQLEDALLDDDEEVAIRGVAAGLLAAAGTGRAMRALVRGLEDPRFVLRRECARALLALQDEAAGRRVPETAVFRAVLRETSVGRERWNDRGRASLEHVFALLSLARPPRPMKLALAGLTGPDEALRGTALEYLETVLPAEVRAALWPFLDAGAPRGPARDPEAVLRDLVASAPTTEAVLAAGSEHE